jgi:hypothetical protein
MATSLAKATELGFAEFASSLISETLNAVVTSILTQEKQVAQLQQQALSSPEDYAKENLTDDIVRTELIRLFPSAAGADKSSVDAGQIYTNIRGIGESPAIYNRTGYQMTKADVETGEGKTVITANGYNHILAAEKLTLAKQHLNLLKTVMARGIPRVYVDNGHITSKLTLRFEADSTATASSTTGARIAGTGIGRIYAQPVSANRPEYLSLQADVLSEVEITFKTVIP